MGAGVLPAASGVGVGEDVGRRVGDGVGAVVGKGVGAAEGRIVGARVGRRVQAAGWGGKEDENGIEVKGAISRLL